MNQRLTQRSRRSVAVVDNDPLANMVLCQVITKNAPSCEISWSAQNGQEALNKLFMGNGLPDIALIDMSMPDISGADLCSRIRRRTDALALYGITAYYDRTYARLAAEAGAQGLIDKSDLRSLLAVLTATEIGVAAPCFEIDFKDPIESHTSLAKGRHTCGDLSPKETEVMNHCAEGLSCTQIAQAMGVSASAVKTYLRRAYCKLGASNKSQAMSVWLNHCNMNDLRPIS